jgi:hypothetical protein
MTDSTARRHADPATATNSNRRRGLLTVPAIAGIAFSAAWVLGLSVNSSSTDVHTPAKELLAGFARHQGAALAQYVITEGVTSVLLVMVVLAVARQGSRLGQRAASFVGAGVLAALIGLTEAVLGIWAAGPATSDSAASTVGGLVEAVNRLDGVKMLALAAMAGAGVLLARHTELFPRWLGWAGIALAITITLSGVGYLFLAGTLATFAYVSLPLLMLYVTAAGIVTGRARR